MNSPFATLYLAIQARIRTAVPAIRHIDQDLGQLEQYQDRPAVSWPAVVLDLDGAQYGDMGEQAQTCTLDVVLRLAFAPYSSANVLAPDSVKEKALEYYDAEWLLNKALHCWVPDGGPSCPYEFSALTRISAGTEKREDNIRVREIRYRIAYEDYSTLAAWNTTPATPNIRLS